MQKTWWLDAALAVLAATAPASAQEAGTATGEDAAADRPIDEIIVTGARQRSGAATKTDIPVIETPQPISIVPAELYQAQGALSVADTLRYVAGVQANPYGPDSRVDSSFIRGTNPLQFRDGMRDLFSYYASIRADPYTFSQVEVVRGPASVLFGTTSLGGLVNLVSKTPRFETGGEVSLRYGSFDRKEALADVTGTLAPGLAGRLVARVRESGTQTDHVPDDRTLLAPSVRWQPGPDTDITLLGLYQEDDGGSTSQFLPVVGTLLPNPNGRLPDSLFIGKPGWDRYDGRLRQGTGIVEHRFTDRVRMNLRARYVDSDLTYLTHYPDSYANPTNPYLDPARRLIGLYADGSKARMDIFSTDNNLRVDFNTGAAVEHVVLAGVDYSWNHVRKKGGFGYEIIDIYDPDYDALSDFGGGLPATDPTEDVAQKQLGFYVQDQIRLWDRASVVLGGRRDRVRTTNAGSPTEEAEATSLRAGLIVEVLTGVSPFVSYTESFEPIAGTASDGGAFDPKRGRQYEAGVKFHPDDATLLTLTGYHIKESNRPVDDPATPDPFDQTQAGSLTSKGFEVEASRLLPGNYEIIASYSYTKAEIEEEGTQLENVPKHNASLWGTKTLDLGSEARLRLGGGVRYAGASRSYGAAFPDGLRTPSYTLVDALAEVTWRNWQFTLNATNLLGKDYYSACLARGDCFMGAERTVFGTLSYRF
ncbi:TonB-dependent siderophore receptor [Rhodospirillum centenum]|uniref:TonB-dependent siderophore receptor, putative n=1 Tax=Rhodospirillum centenum (strain ATCC 51521 / SW) TaxID=414684 RepID=B6IVP8_RHOCS|nr:TonB-dependent siderophore receptor [Rhodospirillum centenum]ACJ00372.1 TonB-dependent siderophore receptor, putative [Rhodospirillum centenum SW]